MEVRRRNLLRTGNGTSLAALLQSLCIQLGPAPAMIDVHVLEVCSLTSGALLLRPWAAVGWRMAALHVLFREMPTTSQPSFRGLPIVFLSSCLFNSQCLSGHMQVRAPALSTYGNYVGQSDSVSGVAPRDLRSWSSPHWGSHSH